jgi:thymidylate kinase
MFTVALIGPDGAGKTTIARELEHVLPVPTKYLYMGVNWDASEHLLPTTRLIQAVRRARGTAPDAGGPPDPLAPAPTGGSLPIRFARGAWRALALANRLAEEWYRQFLAWSWVRRGVLVVFDRHFFSDYYAHDVVGGSRSFGRRLHGFFLDRVYPKPDLVVFLDAAPEVLLGRKGEGTLELLERRRGDYLAVAAHTPSFVAIDAGRPLDAVVQDVAAAVESFAGSRWPIRPSATTSTSRDVP